jgi:hypothetical protein
MHGLIFRQTQEPVAHNVVRNDTSHREIGSSFRINVSFLRRIGRNIENGFGHSVDYPQTF